MLLISIIEVRFYHEGGERPKKLGRFIKLLELSFQSVTRVADFFFQGKLESRKEVKRRQVCYLGLTLELLHCIYY